MWKIGGNASSYGEIVPTMGEIELLLSQETNPLVSQNTGYTSRNFLSRGNSDRRTIANNENPARSGSFRESPL